MTKIAVMGSAPSSRQLAPFNDVSWEIWCCSPPNYDNPRVDAWFELHNLDRKFAHAKNKPYTDTLISHPRVYITKPDPRLPNGLVFPWEELVLKYGTDFFSSSLAWMLAFAIEQKPDKIGMWGVDMSASTEYDQQRPGCKFFIREAEKAGIPVYCPPTSDINVPSPPYAIKEHWPMWQKLTVRRNELTERKRAAESAIENATRDAELLKGALDDLTYTENTWMQPPWIHKEDPNVPLDPQSENTDED